MREYVVSPYQMAAKEGKYYLICNSDQYDDVANYRMDRICDLIILEESARAFETLKGAGGCALNLEDYMKRHVYMYASGDGMARLRIAPILVSDVIDFFGKDVTFSDENDDGERVSIKCGRKERKMHLDQFFDWEKIKAAEPALCRDCDSLEEAISRCVGLHDLFSLWRWAQAHERGAMEDADDPRYSTFPDLKKYHGSCVLSSKSYNGNPALKKAMLGHFCPDGFLNGDG